MKIQIFDVAHGFCAWIVADNGNTMLIDCGRNTETDFEPADYLWANGCRGIEHFFPLNYDEDHLCGLPRLRQIIPIQILHRNPSITPSQLHAIKQTTGGVGPGLAALLEMLDRYTAPVQVPPPDFPNLDFQVFYNNYPEFTDTNNLSQVLFLHYPGLSIVFPGDMEKAGWERLLMRPDFRDNLGKVGAFVASHHGRESGYAASVFEWCKPAIVVISDEAIQYDTQEHCYDGHCTGIDWYGEQRKVLTTRKDGILTITADLHAGCTIAGSR
jgi:beta-lactamase superfamily II metal-dependent hydrolase